MTDLEKAVEALKASFREAIASGGGNVGDDKDDVKMPNDKVWERYAKAVILVLK